MEDIKESKMRHLEMIQGVINRMASNSFLLKGWTVTIVAGLFVFANLKEMESKFILLALIPSFFFWFLDTYFVRQERLFRNLFNHVRFADPNTINFSMAASEFPSKDTKWYKVFLSTTLFYFYIPNILIVILAFLLSFYLKG